MPVVSQFSATGAPTTPSRLSNALFQDILVAFGEFVGTFLFLFMAYQSAGSAIYNRTPSFADLSVPVTDNQTILFIALSFGMSLVVVAWVFFRITGAALNPAITFALWLIGGSTLRRAVLVIIAQLVGGIVAAFVAKGLTLGHFGVANTLSPGYSAGRGVVLEMLTTALLVFTVLMLAAEKSKTTFLAPVGIGLALFIGHLASIGWTGAGINPARSLGPYVAAGEFPGYCWLYFVGQFAGAILAVLLYVLLKKLRYYVLVADGIDSSDYSTSANPFGGPLFRTPRAPAAVQTPDASWATARPAGLDDMGRRSTDGLHKKA